MGPCLSEHGLVPQQRSLETGQSNRYRFMGLRASLGIKDEELTMEQNLASIRTLAGTVASAGLPLSVDLQDGYGSRLREAVTQTIQAGAHGANIEDSIPARGLGQAHSLKPS
ncbi:hypothetical protein DER46DRAFT_663782 [Fusarium sp. MPI-SDFR-AT-0072]|nr:hypothetical protein DER46DRAFT_663782 [Fusarium sp. MPI-SDFR-AT-0072]